MTRVHAFLFGAVFVCWGCGDDPVDDKKDVEESSDDPDENSDWLIRQETPSSVFVPTAIEEAIGEMVDELNDEEPKVGMKLSFIPKELGGFFDTAVLGANRAHAELEVLGNVVAPTLEENNDGESATAWDLQSAIIDEQVSNGAVGIGVAPHSVDVTPSIDAAVEAGATVITFDSDAVDSKRDLYVGTINKEAGKTGGETLAELLGDTVGTVVILGYDDPIWQDGYDRTHEAKKVLEAAGHTVVIRQTEWGNHQSNVDFIQEVLETADPKAVGCLGVFANSYSCAEAAVAAGMEEDLKIAAFDSEAETLEFMEQGIIHVTHVQRVYYMGYMIPFILSSVKMLGLDETKAILADLMVDEERVDTGLDVIPSDKIEEYNLFLDELGAL